MLAGKILIASENKDYNLKLLGKAKRVKSAGQTNFCCRVGKPVYKMQLIE